MPTGFNITNVDYETFITVTFEWDPPNGFGTQTIVESYNFFITPKPVIPISNKISSSPYNLLLAFNIQYTASISAVNCAGASEAATISNIFYGKLSVYLS